MAGQEAVSVWAGPGRVFLLLDVDQAVSVADAVVFASTTTGFRTVGAQWSAEEVDKVRDAAAQAAAEADDLEPRTRMHLVSGGESRC